MFLTQPVLTVPPKRIISLVPSITELLYTLELEDETAGITKFCVHPKHWFQEKIRVGGTKNLNLEKIRLLHPDLIIANKEENIKEQVISLAETFPVWLTDVNTFDEAVEMIDQIGMLTHRSALAQQLKFRIEEKASLIRNAHPIDAVYLIWQAPYMTIGGDTFIHSMMQMSGFHNIYGAQKRYPEITLDEIGSSMATHILLSSEPFPFKQKHVDELSAFFPHKKVILVDGEYFSWYGSRLENAFDYFTDLMKEINVSL